MVNAEVINGSSPFANGGRQDELDELTEALHKCIRHPIEARYVTSQRKTSEGDEDDQQTRLIGRQIVQS